MLFSDINQHRCVSRTFLKREIYYELCFFSYHVLDSSLNGQKKPQKYSYLTITETFKIVEKELQLLPTKCYSSSVPLYLHCFRSLHMLQYLNDFRTFENKNVNQSIVKVNLICRT